MATLSVEEKYELMTRNLAEVLGGDRLKDLLKERDPVLYWGTATTGRPHVAYFVPMSKIADFLRAGCRVKILFADLHAYLDNMKAPWELLAHRVKYYEAVIKAMLVAVGVNIEKLEFVRGTTFQLTEQYTLDVYKFASMCSLHDAQRAGAEVVKQVESPLLSGLLYPGLQALDEEYLKVDAQFGGQDQRKIFVLAKEFLPKLGYAERIHLMNPMVPGLTGNKMSSSDPDSKIDMLDDAATVKRKIAKAFCEEGNVDNNGLLSFLRYVIFPLLELKVGPGAETIFTINRDAKHGPPIVYKKYEEVHRDFAEKKLYPADLKLGVTDALNAFMEPVREVFKTPEMLKLIADAYPKGEAAEGAQPAKPNEKKDYKASLESKPVDLTRVDIRAGKILTCERHKDADNLLVSTVHLGQKEEKVKPDPAAAAGADAKGKEPAKPEQVRIVDDIRSVVSGLAAHYKPEDLVGKTVVAMCNLAPRDLKGVKSAAMILCATAEGGAVQVIEADGAAPGTRVVVPDSEFSATNANDIVLNPKLKVWETVAPELTVVDGTMRYKGLQMMAGSVVPKPASIKNGPVA